MSQATLRDMIKYLNSELLNLLLNYKLDIYSLGTEEIFWCKI